MEGERQVGEKKLGKKVKILFLVLALVLILGFVLIMRQTKKRVLPEVKPEGEISSLLKDQEEKQFEGGVPEEFPDDFPLYSGASLESVNTDRGDKLMGISLILEANASVNDVSDFYMNELGRLAWNTQVVGKNPTSFIAGISKENVEGFIGIVEKGEVSVISITIRITNSDE